MDRRFVLGLPVGLLLGLTSSEEGCVGDSNVAPDASNDNTVANDSSSDVATDAGADADAATGACTLTKPFGALQPINALNVFTSQGGARLSHDFLTVYYSANQTLYAATRSSTSSPWGTPAVIISSDGGMFAGGSPAITPNDQVLYEHGAAMMAINFADRVLPTDPFGPMSKVTTLDGAVPALQPFVQDATTIWFSAGSNVDGGPNAGGNDIYYATITGKGMTGVPVHVDELATAANEENATLSVDGLTIYFSRDVLADGGTGPRQIWMATRTSTSNPFSNIVPVAELNVPTADTRPSWLGTNGCTLWLESNRSGNSLIYLASRPL